MENVYGSACEWCHELTPLFLLVEICVPVETDEGLFSEYVYVCGACLEKARKQQAEVDAGYNPEDEQETDDIDAYFDDEYFDEYRFSEISAIRSFCLADDVNLFYD